MNNSQKGYPGPITCLIHGHHEQVLFMYDRYMRLLLLYSTENTGAFSFFFFFFYHCLGESSSCSVHGISSQSLFSDMGLMPVTIYSLEERKFAKLHARETT